MNYKQTKLFEEVEFGGTYAMVKVYCDWTVEICGGDYWTPPASDSWINEIHIVEVEVFDEDNNNWIPVEEKDYTPEFKEWFESLTEDDFDENGADDDWTPTVEQEERINERIRNGKSPF